MSDNSEWQQDLHDIANETDVVIEIRANAPYEWDVLLITDKRTGFYYGTGETLDEAMKEAIKEYDNGWKPKEPT